MSITALYFDGKTSRRLDVQLTVAQGVIDITGDVVRRCAMADVRISERLDHAPATLTFPDGAYVIVSDNNAFRALLAAHHYQEPLIVRVQQNWRAVFSVSVMTLLFFVLGYLYLLPAGVAAIAHRLPEKIHQAIGRDTLNFLDAHWLAPSLLSASQRTRIAQRFNALATPEPNPPAHQIIFRKSKLGPNAFALPSGQIVLTDEIVHLVNNEDAVMGILAHEIGHLHKHHFMRHMIQGTLVGTAVAALVGDFSMLSGAIPVALNMKYSRDFEREADDYAIAMLRLNGISPTNLVVLFEKLGAQENAGVPYLSSHPSNAERIAHIRQAK